MNRKKFKKKKKKEKKRKISRGAEGGTVFPVSVCGGGGGCARWRLARAVLMWGGVSRG